MENRSKKSLMVAVCIALVMVLVVSVSGCSFEGLIDWYKPSVTETPDTTESPDVPPATEQPTDDPNALPDMNFAISSWADIDLLSQSGLAPLVFAVGDEKEVTLVTGETLTFVILGFNHDDLADGSGKAGITLGMKNCMATSHYLIPLDTNAFGWSATELRSAGVPYYFEYFPAALRPVIKPVVKSSNVGVGQSGVIYTVDSLFLLSEVELSGFVYNSLSNEGMQYEYYKGKTADDYIKRLSDGAGDISSWWLRSVSGSPGDSFCAVSTSGTVFSAVSSSSCGISFCFCV